MRQTRSFGAHRQTKTQNRAAFTMWLHGCSNRALTDCTPESMANSYGLPINDVDAAIRAERTKRAARG